MKTGCCRSEPRCKACPIMFHKELREVRELVSAEASRAVPPHLAGLPECLHKYGPLFEPRDGATTARRLPAA